MTATFEPVKFTKEIKEQWLKDLCSGEYKQAQFGLFDEDTGGYCCLGVLATQFEGLFEASEELGDGNLMIITRMLVDEDDPYDCMPEIASALIGLNDEMQSTLVEMNDGDNVKKPKTFKEIADFIEHNIPAVDDDTT